MKKPVILALILLLVTLLLCTGCGKTDKNNAQTPEASSAYSETDVGDHSDAESEEAEVEPTHDEQVLLNSFADTGDAELNEVCDSILKKILQSNMSDRDKAYAIHQWVVANVDFRGTSATDDWMAGAKYALTYKKGNCYAFYSACRGLLTRAGFENVEATSVNKGHYWNIVKVDGVWRHMDTTAGWGTERFLWTGTQINGYKYFNERHGRYMTYEWDSEGCPNTD